VSGTLQYLLPILFGQQRVPQQQQYQPVSGGLANTGYAPSLQSMASPAPSSAAPTSASDPMSGAVQQAMTQYPWLSRLGAPLKLTQGSGPGESESYMPHTDENPDRGNYTVELRSANAKKDSGVWPALMASESMDWLARQDPTYQQFAEEFRKTMTPRQLRNSQRAYQRDQKDFGEHLGSSDFEDWLKKVQVQEYIRGYLFPTVAPGWKGEGGEGGYTPKQEQLLGQLHSYLMTGQ
jgi:hypothetical protein